MMRKPFKTLSEAYVNFTLRNKFIIPVIMVMFMSFLIFSISLLRDQRTKHDARLQAKAEQITYLLLSSNLESIWDVDRETLERNCLAFFEDQELTRLVIIDTLYGEDVLINFSKEITGTQDIVKTEDFIKDGQKVAALEVVFTNYYIEQNLAQMRNTILGLSVLVFILMIGLIIAVSQIALQPLKGLMDGVQHLTAGELTFRIPLQSKDELGKLAVSFNSMAHELNLFHDHLQELVEQRTTELTAANVHLHQEIAERKRAEGALQASEAELRALFAGMTDVVLMLNREGRYLKIAPTSPNLLYRPADELLGKTLQEVFPKSQADMFLAKIFHSLETRQTVGIEYMLTIGKTDVWFDGRVSPMSHDSVIFVARDMTERKQMENDLRLAKDVALEAKEAAETAQRASEAANRAKSVFLANMSHELRTPLNAILGFSQLLLRDPQINAEQRENLATINRSGNHLLALINDVLELSKIEAGRLELQPEAFDLYDLLLGLEEMFRLRAQQQGLTLSFERAPDVPRYVRVDQNKLHQVLINILGNAVKFTEKGEIRLSVSSKQLSVNSNQLSGESGQLITDNRSLNTEYCLLFTVQDTGVGIAPEEVNSVFDAFVQTTSGQQSHQGTGLGMPISQQFVRMMGGKIAVSSKEGEGSVFTFDIPVEIAEAADVPTARPTRRVICLEPGQPVFRILIVEDEEANRRLLLTLLQPFGFDLREATNGQEAIATWQTWRPHLIWMDMRMPVMDGYEATQYIRRAEEQTLKRAEHQTPNIKHQTPTVIIALTAGVFEKQRAEALTIGCDDFVRKPVNEQEIFEKMQTHLEIRYVYEEDEQKAEGRRQKVGDVLTPEALACLPTDWLETLEQGARRADFILLASVIEQIREQDTRLAGALTQLAEDFEYDSILGLLEERQK